MRVSLTSNVVLVGLIAGLSSVYGCSSGGENGGNNGFPFPTNTGGSGSSSRTGGTSGGSGGSTGSGGSSTSGTGGSGQSEGGSSGTGGSAMSGTGGTTSPGTGGTPGGSTGGTSGGDAGMGGAMGGDTGTPPAPSSDITKVWPTNGCGKAPGPTGRQTIATMGTKPQDAADSRKGAWSYDREYFVFLPQGYDNTKAYPLVLQGPGCGGSGQAVYGLNSSVGNTVIRVGLTPPPNAIGHATNPNEGCFDDKEGDDSVDWVFYEKLYDRLSEQFCFDRNRVFASGNSSGAWFSNEIGCKYAGDAKYPIRAVMPNTGGLPTDMRHVPTCTDKPMSGMWIHEVGDTTNPFTGNKVAIQRAMRVNKCTIGTNFDNTMFDDYPIGGGLPANRCRKIRGCPEQYPLVVCPLAGNGHGSHDAEANNGFSTFIRSFSMPPLITQ